jgi:hypothetical protein
MIMKKNAVQGLLLLDILPVEDARPCLQKGWACQQTDFFTPYRAVFVLPENDPANTL